MQKKHLIGAGITAFSVILGLPYDTVPDNSVHTG